MDKNIGLRIDKCPFCGGEASVATVRYDHKKIRNSYPELDRDIGYYVSCIICPSQLNECGIGYETPEEAVVEWNKRFNPNSTPGLSVAGLDVEEDVHEKLGGAFLQKIIDDIDEVIDFRDGGMPKMAWEKLGKLRNSIDTIANGGEDFS